MKYTKPHVLTTQNASSAIQTGTTEIHKGNKAKLDNATPQARSTTGAYEADE